MKFRLHVLLAAGVLAGCGGVRAQFVWTGGSATNGSISDPTNWTIGVGAPPGNGTENLQFGDLTGTQTNILTPTLAFNSITLNGSSRPAYTFSGTGSTPVVTLNGNLTVGAGGQATFDNTLGLSLSGGAHTFDVAGSTVLEIDGNIGGTGLLILDNAGTVILTGANTYSNGTNLNFGNLQVTGGSISHAGANTFVGISNGNNATLALSGGGAVTNAMGEVGELTGSTGSVTVDGAGSTWTNATYLYVGLQGSGDLTVTNGGAVSSPDTSIGNNTGGYGSVTVDGAGSTLVNSGTLYVGSAGTGTLSLTNGGHATNVDGSIGNNPGGTGVAYVDGAGSVWTTTGNLFVGDASDGYLGVSNGGVVNSNIGYVGSISGASGTAIIDGVGSTWNVTNTLYVGDHGIGEVVLTNGATLNVANGSGAIYLGNSSGGTGQLLIGLEGDIGGTVNATTIETGAGTGSISFQTGSTAAAPYYLTQDGTANGVPVIVAGPTTVSVASGYNVLSADNMYTGGTVLVGGTLVAASNTALGTGPVTFGAPQATLNVAGGVTITNALNLLNGGTLAGNGTFATPVSIGASVTLSPGNSPGTLTFASGLTLAGAGTLNFEVQAANGAAGAGYDLVVVTGGTLDLTADSVTPFKISVVSLDGTGAAGAVGDFSSASGYTWTLFSASSGITGFSAADFVIDTSGFVNGLGTGSFYVTQAGNEIDLNFSSVPEPSTWALLFAGLGLAGLALRRRRSRRA